MEFMFLEDSKNPLNEACERAAKRAVREWDIDYDDAHQEAVLYLAQHIELQNRFYAEEITMAYVSHQIYTNGLRDNGIREGYHGMTDIPHRDGRPIPADVNAFQSINQLYDRGDE